MAPGSPSPGPRCPRHRPWSCWQSSPCRALGGSDLRSQSPRIRNSQRTEERVEGKISHLLFSYMKTGFGGFIYHSVGCLWIAFFIKRILAGDGL